MSVAPGQRPPATPVTRSRLARLPSRTQAARFVRHLRLATRGSALRAFGDGLLVTWTLKRRGLRGLVAAADGAARAEPQHALRVAPAVDAGLGVLPVAATCLRRSVTLLRELHRLQLAATLHVGVRNVAGKTEAHAWVQVGEVVVNDDPALTKTYVELAAGELERLLPSLR